MTVIELINILQKLPPNIPVEINDNSIGLISYIDQVDHFYIGDGILLQEEDELGWIDVPCDWSRTCPPTSARRFGCVEVMFVDGDTRMGHPNHWQMEWNCNSTYHILKYRDANSRYVVKSNDYSWIEVLSK